MPERFEDCDFCGERYVGEDAIASYLHALVTEEETFSICSSCLRENRHMGRGEVTHIRRADSGRL
jgi:hypothetical protein